MNKPVCWNVLAASLALAMLLTVCLPHGYALGLPEESAPFTGVVSLDINPSIELTIADGVVTQALAFNDAGESLPTGRWPG